MSTTEKELSDESLTKYTQSIRKRFIDDLTQAGTAIPADKDERFLLLEVMKDTDRTALSKLKIKSDESIANQNQLAATTIAKINSHFGSKNPFEDTESNVVMDVTKVTVPDSAGSPLVLVPGATDIGVATTNFETFMPTMEDPK